MAAGGRSFACCAAVLLAATVLLSAPATTEAYDSLDPNGNITIKWDIMQWTPDGYVAVVTMFNYQQFRHIGAPGWQLGWTWAKKEVIWSMVGAQTTEQGDCSKFKGNVPHCCKRDPTIVDLLPGTPYNMQIANCCKAGVINTFNQDPANAAASFQISVGLAGTTNKTVKLNYKEYWRVKITITNFNFRMNYTQWNLVAQHPNFDNITQLFSFNYKPLTPYGGGINDTAMFWGVKFYNDLLMQAGKLGNVQSELLLRKDSQAFTFDKGWAFPRRVYFNGDNCVMPPPDAYPWLPNASPLTKQPLTFSFLVFWVVLATLLAYA
ncbi:hypothetical protein PR202_gb10913 [Eleusine coracana subsp. coracana]|uniref:COBRA-like protein n=1 Tax=Eleusine coracana subsp. coracana TaxID=191504 RepID=A0AAV5EL75_ELECO|nr:hypothetical protein PR202_gb10913 [Eleusine coracana subsp. coracana]